MTRVTWVATVCALVLSAEVTLADVTESTSLNNCQNAVKRAAAVFVKNKAAAIAACLQAVSTQIVGRNAGDASGAAGTCLTQFRKLNDSRLLGKSLPEKFTADIRDGCDPSANPRLTHTLADIIGSGAGVPQPLNAENLNAWCAHFGGDGSIDSVQEWIDCLGAAAECDVDSAIAAQYPRALDWLAQAKPAMLDLTAPVTDPNKINDAVAALDAVKAEIDGPDNDNVISIQCGGVPPTGTAVAADVLAGKTFSNSAASGLTGTMPNNGALIIMPSASNQTIPAGYHNGSGSCAGDADLVSDNIRGGVDLFGVSGDPNVVNTSSGNAAPGDLLSGTIAWVDGAQVTGTMPNNGAVTLTPSTSNQAIPAGYHNGSGSCAGDADLMSGNIRAGVILFGVSGDPNVANTSSGDAAPGDLLSGRIAWVDGAEVAGTMPNNGAVTLTPSTSNQAIPAGYHNGSGSCAGDANLTSGNILNGVSLFGVTGTALPAQRLKTGQTTSYGTGSDGDLQKGLARMFTDNGDGTITDNKTGLMWEKKDQSGGIHDWSNTYSWGTESPPFTMDGTMVATFLTALNTAPCFAGHCDWRIPNLNELQSLVNYQNVTPAIDEAFNTNCRGACTVMTCSCTQSYNYWSSTTHQYFPDNAWSVDFGLGWVSPALKGTDSYNVRAVRGG